jgi:hypothetical protein
MNQEVKKYSFFQGIYLGCALILVITFFYFFDSTSIVPQFNIYACVFMFLLLIFPIISVYKYPFIESGRVFKNYFSICFMVMCIALLFTTCYLYFLYNYIDNNLIQEYVEMQYAQCLSNPDCTISFEESLTFYKDDYFSMSGQFHSYVFSLIPCTLYSSIISLLIKMLK